MLKWSDYKSEDILRCKWNEIFLQKFGNISTEIWQYFHRNMEIFLQKYGNIFAEIWKYFYRNMAIFLQKYGNIIIEIWQYFYSNMAIFLQKYGNIFTETWKYFYRNMELSLCRSGVSLKIYYINGIKTRGATRLQSRNGNFAQTSSSPSV